jgi:hypothetical protein
MPLRNHFDSPVADKHSWDELPGMWPSMMVRDLFTILPAGYAASPNVHLGPMFEIDVSTFEGDSADESDNRSRERNVAVELAPSPTAILETDLAEYDEYEVKIYDDRYGRKLVAAIEIVSPANKDRPESRRAFASKVEALLHKQVCVSIVDLVVIPRFNLYAELLDLLEQEDPHFKPVSPDLYAVTLRNRRQERKRKSLLDVWFYPMPLGQFLPTLPIWLNPDERVLLPFESSYEGTCRLLHIA